MKLIEKKCPNCGAGLTFDKDDHEVICEYCKKSYFIQKEKEEKNNVNVDTDKKIVAEYYNLIQKRNAGVKAIICFILVIIVLVGIFITVGILEVGRNIENYKLNTETIVEENKDIYVGKLDEIDSKSLKIFHDETEKQLNKFSYKIWSEVEVSDWEYAGMYLLTSKDEENARLADGVNILYDVYKKTYVGGEVDLEVYATVRYKNLKLSSDGIVINSFNGNYYAPMQFINGGTSDWVYGYLSNEDLFNKVIRNNIDNYNIISSEGMYVES